MSRRRKGTSDNPVPEKKQEVESVVSYRVFFHDCLAKGMVKPWQEKEIHAFFRDLGLTDKEPADKYKDALAKY